MTRSHEEFRHLAEIVDSVIASGATEALAACTSLHDLLVVTRPVPEPPYDVIRVCSPFSLRPVSPGCVLIEHVTVTGHDDRIERPSSAAVPLFWRFIIEKYGVTPPQGPAGDSAASAPAAP